MKNVYEQIESVSPGFEKELDDRELEKLYSDALWDHEGERARHYLEGSLMREAIEKVDTVEGTDFLNRLRDENSQRNRGKERRK